MYIRKIEIGGWDVTALAELDKTEITQSSNGRVSTARLSLLAKDLLGDIALANGLAQWFPTGSWAVVPVDGLNGRAIESSATGANKFCSKWFDAAEGDSLRAIVHAKTTTTTACWLYIEWINAALASLGTTTITDIDSSSYANYESAGVAPANTRYGRIVLSIRSTSATGTLTVPAAMVLPAIPEGQDTIEITGNPDPAFDPGDDVTLFSGYLSRIEPVVLAPGVIRYGLSAQDNTRSLDSVVVASESYTSQTDEYIIDDLFATYLPGISTTNVTSVATLDSIEFVNLTLRNCLDRIAERTGAEWRLGFNDDLHYYEVGSVSGAFGFHEFVSDPAQEHYLQQGFGFLEDFSAPANNVTVLGYHPPQEGDVSTTFLRPNASDSGTTYRIDSVWPPTASAFQDTAGEPYFLYYQDATGTPTYVFGQFLVRFDTSTIPDDATVISATLYLSLKRPTGTTDENLIYIGGQYYSFTTIGSGDYTSTGLPNTNAFDYRPTKVFTAGVIERVAFPLSNLSNISKTGYTGFRISLDKYTGGAFPNVLNPTGRVTHTLEVSETTGPPERRPVLAVTYRPARPAQITGNYIDSASVTAYGTHKRTIEDALIKTTGEAEARAEIETVRYGNPLKTINLSYDRDGLTVGDTVAFKSPSLGIDGNFLVKQLRLRWPGAPSHTRYSAELGEFRPDLIQSLRKIV